MAIFDVFFSRLESTEIYVSATIIGSFQMSIYCSKNRILLNNMFHVKFYSITNFIFDINEKVRMRCVSNQILFYYIFAPFVFTLLSARSKYAVDKFRGTNPASSYLLDNLPKIFRDFSFILFMTWSYACIIEILDVFIRLTLLIRKMQVNTCNRWCLAPYNRWVFMPFRVNFRFQYLENEYRNWTRSFVKRRRNYWSACFINFKKLTSFWLHVNNFNGALTLGVSIFLQAAFLRKTYSKSLLWSLKSVHHWKKCIRKVHFSRTCCN